MKKILIVDDEINIGLLLSKFLHRNGFHVETASSGTAAIEMLEQHSFNLVLCDFRLKDTDGREILKEIKAKYPATGVIIITAYSDIRLAVELIKMGAYDYISKPLYPNEILNTINKALDTQQALADNPIIATNIPAAKPAQLPNHSLPEDFIVGNSAVSRELMREIELIAPTNYSVILYGESGTGKEAVAKSIHLKSKRRDKPFVALDCGSLTKELAGSEFFGHEKGSFTGALNTKIGHFEMANGGTLFLDEIGNLSYESQMALLRTVQERKVKRIGSTKEIELDVRIIVATNENLLQAIADGHFREDLYYRFNEFMIHLPALRERENDLILFANTFLLLANKELNRQVERFSDDVIQSFKAYPWPGNIRELKNVVRRAVLLSEGKEVQAKALPLEISHNHHSHEFHKKEHHLPIQLKPDLKNVAQEAEYETIMNVLKEVRFNKSKAAELLQIDRKTLYNKMKGFSIK
ncbi:MAG: sigma-54-dependent transcriptional regulator [Sphingobacteriaceae bacterium]